MGGRLPGSAWSFPEHGGPTANGLAGPLRIVSDDRFPFFCYQPGSDWCNIGLGYLPIRGGRVKLESRGACALPRTTYGYHPRVCRYYNCSYVWKTCGPRSGRVPEHKVWLLSKSGAVAFPRLHEIYPSVDLVSIEYKRLTSQNKVQSFRVLFFTKSQSQSQTCY